MVGKRGKEAEERRWGGGGGGRVGRAKTAKLYTGIGGGGGGGGRWTNDPGKEGMGGKKERRVGEGVGVMSGVYLATTYEL